MLPTASSEIITAAVLLLSAAAAAATDLRTGRIPNGLTVSTGATGLVLAATGIGSAALTAALVGGALGLALMTPGYLLGGTGAGDVKLMAAFGTLLGPGATVTAFLASAITGGGLAVFHAVRRRRLAHTITRAARLVVVPGTTKAEIDRDARSTRFAYGPALAAGAIFAVFWR